MIGAADDGLNRNQAIGRIALIFRVGQDFALYAVAKPVKHALDMGQAGVLNIVMDLGYAGVTEVYQRIDHSIPEFLIFELFSFENSANHIAVSGAWRGRCRSREHGPSYGHRGAKNP